MADPLSIVSSIAGLIALSSAILTAGYKFINTVLSAPEEFRGLICEISYLSTILTQLVLHSVSAQVVPLIKEGILQDCENVLRHIKSLIYDCERGARTIHAFLWPLRQNDILKYRERLSRLYATLQTAISVNNTSTLLSIEYTQDQTYKAVMNLSQTAMDNQGQKILDWLSHLDPKVKHRDTTRLRQPNTARWILEEQIICEWLDRGTFVWLHGAMGIGKTVLV
jgi:hypothetical protein